MYSFVAPVIAIISVILQQHQVAAEADWKLKARQTQDLSFCFGENSICVYSNNLFDDCQNYLEELPQWYSCICANGYVSVDEACVWCQAAYDLSYYNDVPQNKEGCSSIGATIAPIPSSILAAESQYNKTYTGVISGATATTTGHSGSAGAITSTSGLPAQTTSTTSTEAQGGGGINSVVTLGGGGGGQATTTGSGESQSITTVTTTKAASGSGYAEGQCVAWVLSVIIFGLSVVNLI